MGYYEAGRWSDIIGFARWPHGGAAAFAALVHHARRTRPPAHVPDPRMTLVLITIGCFGSVAADTCETRASSPRAPPIPFTAPAPCHTDSIDSLLGQYARRMLCSAWCSIVSMSAIPMVLLICGRTIPCADLAHWRGAATTSYARAPSAAAPASYLLTRRYVPHLRISIYQSSPSSYLLTPTPHVSPSVIVPFLYNHGQYVADSVFTHCLEYICPRESNSCTIKLKDLCKLAVFTTAGRHSLWLCSRTASCEQTWACGAHHIPAPWPA